MQQFGMSSTNALDQRISQSNSSYTSFATPSWN
jgi:hypothetical protein